MGKDTIVKERERARESTMEALREAEARQLAEDRDDPASPSFVGDARERIGRRRFLVGWIAAAGIAAALSRSASART